MSSIAPPPHRGGAWISKNVGGSISYTGGSRISATTSTSHATGWYMPEGRAHCRNHNRHSIGICYEGGLDAKAKPRDTRTEPQKTALRELLRQLKDIFPQALVVGHRDLDPMKECPCFDAAREYSDELESSV